MEPLFTTQSLTLADQTKFVCIATYAGRKYIFRYAYDTQAQAQSVLGNIRRYFGQPAGIETDLAFNYWRLVHDTRAWRFVQRTSQKNSWYISKGV